MKSLAPLACAALLPLLALTGCADEAGTPWLSMHGVRDGDSLGGLGVEVPRAGQMKTVPVPDTLCVSEGERVTVTGVTLYKAQGITLHDVGLMAGTNTTGGGTNFEDPQLRGDDFDDPLLHPLPTEVVGCGLGAPQARMVYLRLALQPRGSIEGFDIAYTADGVAKVLHATFTVRACLVGDKDPWCTGD